MENILIKVLTFESDQDCQIITLLLVAFIHFDLEYFAFYNGVEFYVVYEASYAFDVNLDS